MAESRVIWYEPGMMSEISLAPLIERIASGALTPQVTLRGLSGRMRPQTGWRVHEVALSTQLFYLVLDGEIRGDSAGVGFTAGTGDLMWANQGEPLEIRASPGKEPMIYRFRLQLLEKSGEVTGAPFAFHVFPAARGCEPWMARIVDEVAAPGPLLEARIRGLMLCFLTELDRSQESAETLSRELSRTQRRKLHAYFVEEIKRRPSPADLAAQVELSPDYFTRCFKASYGVPPRRWMLEERLRLAGLRLIESNLTVSQVATEFGYADVFAFSRQFKAVLGYSPTDYRRRRGYNAVELLP